ncbi:MAG: polysaccharide export protein [Novosphingobium sp.]|nr:polysaccharide export protein [Novosphingobium sp.]
MTIQAKILCAFLLLIALPHSIASAKQGPEPNATLPPTPEYRINPGDEIEIYVWGEERLQRTMKVLPDGTIAFPLIGQIKVQGYLPQELEMIIVDGLKNEYRGQVPNVTVSVVSPDGMQFSVLGNVKSAGTFSPHRYVNLLEGLSMAGGPSEFANLSDVMIIRKTGGRLQVIRANLAPFFRDRSSAASLAQRNIPRLEAGDAIVVP